VKKLALSLLVSCTIAKIAAVLVRGPVSLELDAAQYWRLSSVVLSGDLLLLSEPVAYRTPVYPWFLAIVRTFAGQYALLATVVLQGAMSLATILIAGNIAARITRLPNALPLTILAALPAVSALTFSAAILTETLFVFLLMLNLLAVLDYAKYETTGRSLWVGFTFAATLLTRPIVLLIWIPHVLFVLWIHWRRRQRLGKHGRYRLKLGGRMLHIAAAGLTVLLLISPWLMRNQYLFGKPFVTEFVGRNIWIVTFQDGSGAGLELPATEASQKLQKRLANVGVENWRHTWSVSKGLVASGLNDPQADRLMKEVSVDAIKTNQPIWAEKAFRRVVNFWRCAATDLPQQGKPDGQYFGQTTWLRLAPPVDWAIEYRWSQSVVLNMILTGIMGAALIVLLWNHTSRPFGFWIALVLSYFAVVTGILEIPDYRSSP
jgi:hypothetical protein